MQNEEKSNQNGEKKKVTAAGKREQQQSRANIPGADQDPPKTCGDAGISGLFLLI